METIRVAVHGAAGRMGRQVVSAVCSEADLTPVGAADAVLEPGLYPLPDGSGSIPQSNALEEVIGDADVVVDFSTAEGAASVVRTASAHRVNVVIGTTGIGDADLEEARVLAKEHDVGIIVAPNFAMGAVLMIHLARVAGRFFDYADLTEMHHEAKIDAPSGNGAGDRPGRRGGQGRRIHAPRRPRRRPWPARAAGWMAASTSTAPVCRAGWPTTSWCSARWARPSRSATTRSTARASCPGSSWPSGRSSSPRA